jgi:hypothetical protein
MQGNVHRLAPFWQAMTSPDQRMLQQKSFHPMNLKALLKEA